MTYEFDLEYIQSNREEGNFLILMLKSMNSRCMFIVCIKFQSHYPVNNLGILTQVAEVHNP